MRLNPIQSLSPIPPRPKVAGVKQAPELEPQDQASIGATPASKPARKPFPWGNMARGLTMAAALVAGVMGGLGVATYSSSQHGQATEQLLSADKNLTQEQRQLASTEMNPMGEKTLRWMGASGERIYITETDEQVLELHQQLGKLHPLQPGAILSEGMKLRSALEKSRQQPDWQNLETRRDSLEAQTNRLRQQWMDTSKPAPAGMGVMGMMGFGNATPPPPQLMELSSQQQQVQSEIARLQTEAVQQSGADTQVVRLGIGSLEMLLEAAQAKTPEQRQEYKQLLSAMNGGEWEEQQAEQLQRQQDLLAKMGPGPVREMVAKSVAHPEKLVLGLETPLLIPQFSYHEVNGRTARLQNDDPSLGNLSALGLHFGGRGVVQIDADQLGGKTHVINHELGHSMDDLLRQQNPGFHAKWSVQVKEALAEARQRDQDGQPVASRYSLTNQAEYVAEGVEYYFENPEMLKKNDPKLFELTEQLLERADAQGDLNLKESLALLAGAGLLGLGFALTGRKSATT